MRPVRALLVVLVLLLTACGAAAVQDVGAAPSAVPVASPTPVADDDAGPQSEAAPPTDAAAPAPVDSTADGDGPPGTPVPWADNLNTTAPLGVTGVEADDVLNVRSAPGVGEPILARLDPHRRGMRLTGDSRMVGQSAWYEIVVGDTTGWVNGRFVNLVAGTTDITAQVRDAGGALEAPTMTGLAEQVVNALGLDDGYRIVWGPDRDSSLGAEQQRRAVISDGPRETDLGEITVDVIDTFDDAVAAERLAIFGEPAGGGFELRTVELTQFCHVVRGAGEVCA